MSVAIACRPAQARGLAPCDEGASVCDADGHRLGIVESVDLETGRFTIVEAGFLLGPLHGTCDLPFGVVARVEPGRVQLTREATVRIAPQ